MPFNLQMTFLAWYRTELPLLNMWYDHLLCSIAVFHSMVGSPRIQCALYNTE